MNTQTPQKQESFLNQLWASIASTVAILIICCGLYPLLIWGVAKVAFPWRANGSLVNKSGAPTSKDDEAVGSSLLGQNFAAAKYFHPRPSAAGSGYDASNSSGSNLGPLSDKLLNGQTTPATTQPPAPESLTFDGIRLRCIHYAVDNNIAFKLYQVAPDGTKAQQPLSKFQDKDGSLNDIALVDAFPHPATDPADKTTLIASDFAAKIPADAVTASGSGLDPHISIANAKLQCDRVAKARNIPSDQVEKLVEQCTEGPDLGILGEAGVNVLRLNLSLDGLRPNVAATPASRRGEAASLPPTSPLRVDRDAGVASTKELPTD